ncbi:conserved exported hypothetical protein [Paraburkholderia piptadeniae]|uniref:Uncharacterized protein n=1 Tax=Paraburkholderia piptadeniae TaxID=1701573 RepID=A0A1N7RM01_9BURK|nr:hypothetical protein [Paraburkholderia piptadeniae]SIT36149.1 conserved exported hypothetical protein [Paraburkholderia piptadeniae]
MAAHLHSRQRSPLEYPLRSANRSRAWLQSIALASALLSSVALMPGAHAQNNNAAPGNGAKAAAAAKNNANGAPPKKTAAQRTQEDAQRLLGGPNASLGGYEMDGATPDSERESLLNSERMRVAKPNAQAAGGPAAAGGNGGNGANAGAAGGKGAANAVAIKRPARGGAAANAGAANGAVGGVAGPAGAAGQRGGAMPPGDAGVAANAVYGNPYINKGGRDIYRSPW